MPKPTLFLHWGPGAHARVEKNLLPVLFPNIDWSSYHFWDQPGSMRNFSDLVEATLTEARILGKNRPIQIVAHSSGGAIAVELLKRIPDQVERVTLLGTNTHPETAFVHLARHLGISSPAFQAAENELTPETFWPLIGEITQNPRFGDAYWAAESNGVKIKHQNEASRHPSLDLSVFQGVLNDWLTHPRPVERSPFQGEVSLVTGAQDPLLDIAAETLNWRRIFPQLRDKTLTKCGHFIHFESDPASWRPAD